jgi:hypothetical protein
MAAGLPGVGIGGLFYLLSAVALPLRSLWRRARRVPDTLSTRELVRHLVIAAGIVGGIGVAGWLLAFALPGGITPRASGASSGGGWPGHSAIRVAAIAAGFITLAVVLMSVEISRLAFRWRAARASLAASGAARR